MQHKNVMHLLIPCLTEPEKLFPLKLSQLPEKSKRTSMSNSSKGEVQFLSLNKATVISTVTVILLMLIHCTHGFMVKSLSRWNSHRQLRSVFIQIKAIGVEETFL